VTRNARIALIVAAVAVAVVAAVVIGTGGDDEKDSTQAATTTTTAGETTATTTAPAKPKPKPIPTIRLRDGKPVGGIETLEFESGKRARFAIASDTEQEIHVHGYDIEKTIPAGGRATFSFKAKAQGIFEIESHTTEQHVGNLKVVP
jgi:Cu/Zn superoxide dismutase